MEPVADDEADSMAAPQAVHSAPHPPDLSGKTFKFDAFLTHDWGDDEFGRNNHERVAKVNSALQHHGIVTWYMRPGST